MKMNSDAPYPSASGKKAFESRSKLSSIRIEPADNGYVMEEMYSTDGKDTMYRQPTRTVHETIDGVVKAVEKCLGSKKTDDA